MSLLIYATFLIVLAPVLHRLSKIGQRPPDYPPGPPTIPFFGNLLQMPTTRGHLKFQKWANEYGPVYSLILVTKVMIVVSDGNAVKDLLDKKGNTYSSRPDNYLAKLVSGFNRMLFMVGRMFKCSHLD